MALRDRIPCEVSVDGYLQTAWPDIRRAVEIYEMELDGKVNAISFDIEVHGQTVAFWINNGELRMYVVGDTDGKKGVNVAIPLHALKAAIAKFNIKPLPPEKKEAEGGIN